MKGFNKIPHFIKMLSSKKYRTMDKIGKFAVEKMDFYAAVDSGYMRSRNNYKITGFKNPKLKLINDAEYSLFVEYGTVKMKEQPFMRPAIFNHLAEIRIIAGEEFNF